MSIWCGPGSVTSRAGAAAAPLEAAECGGAVGTFGAGSWVSGSRMSAPSPRPSAFLGIDNYLLGELRVAFRALAMNIVENDGFSKTWCFCEPHISRNYALEDLGAEETAQVGGNLPGECGALVVHGEKDTLDLELWVQRSPN